MAKVKGQLHSDHVKGSVGPVTHRLYRGVGTASKHRSPSRKRLTKLWIKSPCEISGCWSRFVAGTGYTLRTVGVDNYLKYLLDLAGGFGTLSQLIDPKQPRWFSSDPVHGNQSYILPDGVDDFIETIAVSPPFSSPLEIWIIASDTGVPTSYQALFSLHPTSTQRLIVGPDVPIKWQWQSPSVILLAPWGDGTVKVWRIVFDGTSIQIFWNGVPQSDPKPVSALSFSRLRLFASRVPSFYYSKRLFEINFFRRILNPVEVQVLHSYFYGLYDLP